MSETLRDLVVSLSLNADNFSRNIRSVNRQIQEAESRFVLAGAGVAGFEKTANGLSAKLGTLQQKLGLQKSAVNQYERALAAADKKLQSAYARQQSMRAALTAAAQRQAALKTQVAAAARQYASYKKALGESDSATIAARQNLDALKGEYREASGEVKKLQGQLVACEKSTQNAADAVSVANTNLNNAKAALKTTEAEITKTNAALLTAQSRWTAAGSALTNFGKSAATISRTASIAGKNLTRYLTTPVIALGTYAAKSAIDMEDAFAGVRKTVEMTEDEFEDLDRAIREMTLVKPSTYEDIAFVAETAGQLGVATDAIKTFTSVMTDLANVSTDLTAEDAATNLAKLANITGMEQTAENFERLGSTILECGVNSASTEASIVEMSMRLAAAGKQVGLSEAQIVGFATALSSVGIEAQMGGTAFSKALVKMEVACETGGEALRDFAGVAGMSQKEFKALFQSDPAAAFQAFISGLAQMDDEGVSTIKTLQDIGFTEVRLRDTTLRLVNAGELLSGTQRRAADAWKKNTAITDLVNERYNTTAKRLQMLKNRARLAGETLGDILVPVLEQLMDKTSGVLNSLMRMDEAQRAQIVKTALMVAALGPALSLFGKISLAVGTVSTGLGKFATAVGAAGGGVKGFASVALSSKLVVAGLTAGLIAGTVALIDYASGAKAARDALEGMEKTASEWRAHQAQSLYANDGLGAFGLDKESFTSAMQTAEQWRDRLLAVWSDGRPESDAIVKTYVDSFKALNVGVRASLEELRQNAGKSGRAGLAESIQTDIDKLGHMDAEIERLLKKRQNKKLTDADKIRLDELLEQREAIIVKYKLAPENGYEQILQGVQDEVNRALARGESGASVTVYAEGLTAAAQGYAAVTGEIDRQYDSERALIALMEEGEEKQAAYQALDAKYKADRAAATREYAEAIRQLLAPVWESGDIQQVNEGMDALFQLFREYSTLGGEGYQDPKILEKMHELFEDMDEDDLISYLALLQQVQSLLDGGMSEEEVHSMFGADITDGLDQLAALADFARDRSGELSGLSDILNNLVSEEMRKIAVDLDMTAAEARWAEFSENPGAITTDAVIRNYANGENVTVPSPSVTISITGYDLAAYNAFVAANPVEVKGVVRLGEKYENPEAALADPDARFYLNGRQVEVDVVPRERITADTLFVYDTDGTMHVLVTPEIQGTPESVSKAGKALETPSVTTTSLGKSTRHTDWAWLNSLIGFDTLEQLSAITTKLRGAENQRRMFGELLSGYATMLKNIGVEVGNLSPEEVASLQTYVAEVVTAIQNGGELSEDDLTRLQTILDFVSALETAGIGQNVTAGIGDALEGLGVWDADSVTAALSGVIDAATRVGQDAGAGIGVGMAGADISQDAAAVAENTESALRAPGAFDSHSPANKTRPVGRDAALGVGKGMAEADLSTDTATVAENAVTALTSAMSAAAFKPIGLNAMLGMAAGIRAGQGSVVSAIRTVARAAVLAAKTALEIRSPSRVFRDEVGIMMMKGLGEGVLKETEAQARAIRNAARYITGEAQSGTRNSFAYDNRRTYNQQASATVQVERLYVRDEQDVRALAVEIAQLTRRRQAALGTGM